MAKIYSSVEELIGRTPLVRLSKIEKKHNLEAQIIAKLESFNPGGSAKDRVAKSMLDDAEAKGLLKKDGVIIEPTSGNTGIGLAAVAAARGYNVIIVMPDSMSPERQKLMKAYGAKLFLTPGAEGMKGAIKKAEEIRDEIPGSFIPDQFANPANAAAHRETTGPEIWEDTDGEVDIFVCGIGTGGTITGVGEYLKSKKADVQIIGVEPFSSPFLTEGKSGPHGLQGIGAGFVPKVLNTDIYDEIITVSDTDAYAYGRTIGRTEGILVGISSGAALYAAVTVAKRPENKGKNIVVLLPDTGDRYLSTIMFSE
ncbi:MAG: cysteine synthase A [Clostridia bacterium]|nr:cysteine synthase A [Clostridia bacterium]